MTVQQANPKTGIRRSLSESGRLARLSSRKLARTEVGMDHQVELEELAGENVDEAKQIDREIAVDLADDRRRFLKYSAVQQAIQHGTKSDQLAAFQSLVAHVENDEMREDTQRLGHRKARGLHARRLIALRTIFRDEIMPLLVGEGGRA